MSPLFPHTYILPFFSFLPTQVLYLLTQAYFYRSLSSPHKSFLLHSSIHWPPVILSSHSSLLSFCPTPLRLCLITQHPSLLQTSSHLIQSLYVVSTPSASLRIPLSLKPPLILFCPSSSRLLPQHPSSRSLSQCSFSLHH